MYVNINILFIHDFELNLNSFNNLLKISSAVLDNLNYNKNILFFNFN